MWFDEFSPVRSFPQGFISPSVLDAPSGILRRSGGGVNKAG